MQAGQPGRMPRMPLWTLAATWLVVQVISPMAKEETAETTEMEVGVPYVTVLLYHALYLYNKIPYAPCCWLF